MDWDLESASVASDEFAFAKKNCNYNLQFKLEKLEKRLTIADFVSDSDSEDDSSRDSRNQGVSDSEIELWKKDFLSRTAVIKAHVSNIESAGSSSPLATLVTTLVDNNDKEHLIGNANSTEDLLSHFEEYFREIFRET